MSKNDQTHFQKICCKIFKSVFDHFGILCIKGLIAKVFLKIKNLQRFFQDYKQASIRNFWFKI